MRGKIQPVLGILVVLFALGCGQQNTRMQSIQAQIDADKAMTSAQLKMAEGRFAGPMYLYKSDQSFQLIVELHEEDMITQMPSSDHPAETIEIPVLRGNFIFPILQSPAAEQRNFPGLIGPLGGYKGGYITTGRLNAENHVLTLPYTLVNNGLSVSGQFTGTLIGNSFSGEWKSQLSGVTNQIGHFDLVRSQP